MSTNNYPLESFKVYFGVQVKNAIQYLPEYSIEVTSAKQLDLLQRFITSVSKDDCKLILTNLYNDVHIDDEHVLSEMKVHLIAHLSYTEEEQEAYGGIILKYIDFIDNYVYAAHTRRIDDLRLHTFSYEVDVIETLDASLIDRPAIIQEKCKAISDKLNKVLTERNVVGVTICHSILFGEVSKINIDVIAAVNKEATLEYIGFLNDVLQYHLPSC